MQIKIEHILEHEYDEGSCWLCHGEKRVEWSGLGEENENGDYEVLEGIYDPCP